MKLAYLIIAHNTPKHLQRLIAALSSDSCKFFIHLDKKSNADEYSNIKGNHIHFIQNRIEVFWADFSMIEAELALLETALADQCKFDRFVLLSGACYPIRSAQFIERFFAANATKEFIGCGAVGEKIAWLTQYKPRPGDSKLGVFLRTVLIRAGMVPRERNYQVCLQDMAPCTGPSWWALTREACGFILTFLKKKSCIVKFFRNVNCPDEILFQTILHNSPFRTKISGCLTYTDWSDYGPNPAAIAERHLRIFQELLSRAASGSPDIGEKLFARKFSDSSGDLVARLQCEIDQSGGRFIKHKADTCNT